MKILGNINRRSRRQPDSIDLIHIIDLSQCTAGLASALRGDTPIGGKAGAERCGATKIRNCTADAGAARFSGKEDDAGSASGRQSGGSGPLGGLGRGLPITYRSEGNLTVARRSEHLAIPACIDSVIRQRSRVAE